MTCAVAAEVLCIAHADNHMSFTYRHRQVKKSLAPLLVEVPFLALVLLDSNPLQQINWETVGCRGEEN